jgi:hypothetical protein
LFLREAIQIDRLCFYKYLGDTMPTSLQQGINAAKAGQTEKALDHLKDAIIEEPQNADVWVWIAAIIDDLEKQEIFLNKALEIEPHNIPAQRGLSYLQKRKQHEERVKDETLSDHTQPISPFPRTVRSKKQAENIRGFQVKSDDLVNLTAQAMQDASTDEQGAETERPPRLTPFEIILLGVVVLVFAFIGLLASSALFGFDLPWGLLTGNRPRLSADPPYPGVFLYEEDVLFDIEAHQGPPVANIGIPPSSTTQPVIVFWQMGVEIENITLIHESGTYVDFRSYQGGSSAVLIQPTTELQNGLYCLQEIHPLPPTSPDTYYCFRVNLPPEE